MARSHGRIYTSIWDDPEFVALEPGPQRLYLFLVSQRDLNQAGLLPLRLRRWARHACGIDVGGLSADLDALRAARFVLVDEDTEEVLVRTFVRNDGVWRQPKVMQRMGEDAREIASSQLRCALLEELDRIPVGELSTEPASRGGRSARDVVKGVIADLRAAFADDLPAPQETPPDTPPHTLPDTPPDSPSATGGEGYPMGSSRAHHAASPYPIPPTPVPPTAGGAARPPAPDTLVDVDPPPAPPLTVNRRAQALATAYRELVPLSKFPAVMRIAKQAIDAGYPDDAIAAALARLAAENRPVTVDTLRVELEGAPTPRPRGRAAPGEEMAQTLELGRRLQAEHDAQRLALEA